MLQVARLGAQSLGESLPLVRGFLRSCLSEDGAGKDRDGRADLYYTIFAIAGLAAVDEPLPVEALQRYLTSFGDGASLDFVHLGALARCWSMVGGAPRNTASAILSRLETFRASDGGYDGERGSLHGNAYGGFVALGAYQDSAMALPEPLRLVQSLKFLEAPGGSWGNAPGLPMGSTNATAAAVTMLHQLDMPVHSETGIWLLNQLHLDGGFLAMPKAPIPDLLSTATTLHALACLDVVLVPSAKEKCLDFLDSLWSAEGGFHGHWADEHLDAEYTYYGLLALGHLT